MYALECVDTVKVYRSGGREIRAVDGVSLTVEDHGIFGLLGMNGAGKSTLIKICTGLVKADGGKVFVFGKEAGSPEAKSAVNISPQETAVAPLLSVRENLELISRVYGADKQSAQCKAEEIMERLKLTDRAKDRAGKLSGGLMRRLSIGMAIITEPRLVFLDEPTLGLDVVARRELWKYVRAVADKAAVVLTTHYLEEAEALCAQIAIMANGRIAAVGTAEELKEKSGKETFEDAFLKLSGVEE